MTVYLSLAYAKKAPDKDGAGFGDLVEAKGALAAQAAFSCVLAFARLQ
ncbi:hypothetical protein [Pseudoduganella violacea]|nr:hypothetical protein [Pseudoduganella violacea]